MKFILNDYDDIKTYVDGLTVEKLLTMVCCPNMSALSGMEPYEDCVAHLIASGTEGNNRKLAKKMYSASEYKLIAADFENGASAGIKGKTRFPEMMAL